MVNARRKRQRVIMQACLDTMREKHGQEYAAIVTEAYRLIPERARQFDRWENRCVSRDNAR